VDHGASKLMMDVYCCSHCTEHRITETLRSVCSHYYSAPLTVCCAADISVAADAAAAAAVAAADWVYLCLGKDVAATPKFHCAPLRCSPVYKHSIPRGASLQPARKPIPPAQPAKLRRRCYALHAPGPPDSTAPARADALFRLQTAQPARVMSASIVVDSLS